MESIFIDMDERSVRRSSETEVNRNSSLISASSSETYDEYVEDIQTPVHSLGARRAAILDADVAINEMRIACEEAGFTRKQPPGEKPSRNMDLAAFDCF
eukprot:CAMPEP_0196586628 /NCGR_PEP_ID=MMETSP1081-20130531/55017_1 /TAXON_ID=36882 /ORGANISM="Pyramimonas amylifera, Strain CCMP720" /LENGTH=98 /DNA_ID=CAMNT_0041908575 /DNA_START=190 /DNA_END=486 /DNA_ORIENTATION=-